VQKILSEFFLLLVAVFSFGMQPIAYATELEMSGYFGGEARLFPSSPMYQGQNNNSYAITGEPEFYLKLDANKSFTATPFFRVDSSDSEQTHYDLREFYFLAYGDWWEIRAGLDKVFWGVTEFVHLVDIVNQTDGLEGFDGEDKLGQPMIKLSLIKGSGSFDFFLLPYFRERKFTGKKSRLRFPFLVDNNNPLYENSEKEKHVDLAARYKQTLGDFELALSLFEGTARTPTFTRGQDSVGNPLFIPFYEQIFQTGLELQYNIGDWLWKLEVIDYQRTVGKSYQALQFGYEYTFYGVRDSIVDISFLTEWAWNGRGEQFTTPADHDLMFGVRMAMNDISSSELLAGFTTDYKNGTNSLSLEGSRRFGDNWKAEIQGFYFLDASSNDLTYFLQNDDFIEISLAYYY